MTSEVGNVGRDVLALPASEASAPSARATQRCRSTTAVMETPSAYGSNGEVWPARLAGSASSGPWVESRNLPNRLNQQIVGMYLDAILGLYMSIS